MRLLLACALLGLCACGGGSPASDGNANDTGAETLAGSVHVNQVGYHPASVKYAVTTNLSATRGELVDAAGSVVFSTDLLDADEWGPADETVRVLDFSSFDVPGRYTVQTDKGGRSPSFAIAERVYGDVGLAAIRGFYLVRSGTALPPRFAGHWARDAGHADTHVLVHESAAGPARVAGDVLSSPGGWYDAGDYNKYIVNASFAQALLLLAYDNCAQCFPDAAANIPESGNGRSDLLDEIRFNLDWMLTMQDPADGGVYHKLTSKDFAGEVMPVADLAERYVVQKSTAATLDFAATTAMAARIFGAGDPDYGTALAAAAVRAWQWASDHPDLLYRQPPDISTGTYANPSDDLSDEWSWARVELYLATRDDGYLSGWSAADQPAGPPSWDHVVSLAWLSLTAVTDIPADLARDARAHLLQTAERMKLAATSGYRVSMGAYRDGTLEGAGGNDFSWGSNGVAAVHAIMLLRAHQLTGDTAYLDAAVGDFDYLLGRNPMGMSYVTGLGEHPPMHIHHRPSRADGIVDPVPGLLAGGPHLGHQDATNCDVDYVVANAPARSYLDDFCSYATNEIAINWNAALVAAAYFLQREFDAAQ